MSKFRILSIFLAVGLLVGALGVGPVLAGQIDVTGLDTRDASYAPAQTTVDLDDEEVEWTDANGVTISHVNIGEAVFYIQDSDLQTVSDPQIALWDGDGSTPLFATEGEAEGFNVLTGGVGKASPGTFTLTGLPDGEQDRAESTGGILDNDDQPTDAGTDRFDNEWYATTTFVMFKEFYDDHDDDDDDTDLNPSPRVPRTGIATTTDGTVNGGNVAGTPIHKVSKFEVFNPGKTPATSTLTSQAVPAPENDLVKILGGTTGSYERVKITFTHHSQDVYKVDAQRARVVSTSDPDGEFVQIAEVASEGKDMPSPDSTVFLGTITLTGNAAKRGDGDGEVWVQHGDTLTVSYLDDEGDVVETDEITVDTEAPAISGLTPANNTVTSINNPTLQFDATDSDSRISVKDPGDSFRVKVGTEYQAEPNDDKIDLATGQVIEENLSYVAVVNGYRVIYAVQTSWLKTFGLKDGTPFNVSVWAQWTRRATVHLTVTDSRR